MTYTWRAPWGWPTRGGPPGDDLHVVGPLGMAYTWCPPGDGLHVAVPLGDGLHVVGPLGMAYTWRAPGDGLHVVGPLGMAYTWWPPWGWPTRGGYIQDPAPLIEMSRASCPGGRFSPNFLQKVIIITGLNKLSLYVLAKSPRKLKTNSK